MGATPNTNIIVREHGGRPFYEAKFRLHGRQVKRRIGAAWLERDLDTGSWRPRKGRVPKGSYDERGAIVAAARIVDAYIAEVADQARVERERRTRGVTFREVAHAYLAWLADVAGAKPATLRDHGYVLGEPGIRYKHGTGTTAGHVMAALGDQPAAKITTRDVEAVLATVSSTGASASTVNKYRKVMCAVFSYGCKPSTFALPANPAESADRRREPHPAALVFYSPEEVEAFGRPLDGSALRRRYRRAQVAAGVRPLRFHDLRHTFGSRLAAKGVDVVAIQKAMGHSALATTSRYLHARPASEQAQAFTAAFTADAPDSNAVAA